MIIRFIGFLFTAGVIVGVCFAAVIGYYLWTISDDLPNAEELANYQPPVMTRIHAADGRLVAEYAREKRLFLPIESIPQTLIQAVLSAEDKNFYKHSGLDFQGIARAVITNLQNFGSKRLVGASTITQQVAKNFLLTNDRTLDRKVKEAILAIRIESQFTKAQILELYLNEIYLGLGSYGMAAASLVHFDKSVNELSVSEAAYLAALPKAPGNYHPFRHPERAIERRNWVLERMYDNGFIDTEMFERSRAEPLEVTPRESGARIFAADFFAEEVRRVIGERYGVEALYDGGLSVRTTLDPVLQQAARKVLVAGLVEFDRKKGWRGPQSNVAIEGDWGKAIAPIEALNDIAPWQLGLVLEVGDETAKIGIQPTKLPSGALSEERVVGTVSVADLEWARWTKGPEKGRAIETASQVLQPGDIAYFSPSKENDGTWHLQQVPEIAGAMVVMDPHTGRVKALVGGFSYAASEFNRATQAQRQPGSAFKPIVYAAALDNGYTPSSVVMDAPISLSQGPGLPLWTPQNYSKKYYGPSTLRRGIENSRNVMTVRLARDMGMPLIVEYARRFGIYDNLKPHLAMSLGAGETTVLKMTAAYSVFANGGKKIEPTVIDRVQDRYGRTVYRHDPRGCEACNGEWVQQDEPELVDNRPRVLDPYTAYQMTSMLEGVVQRGTATRLKVLERPVAGKTGTTNDEKDAWFVGYSPDLAVGVYIGYDKPRAMGRGSTGGVLAAPVVRDFMAIALADSPPIPFRVPSGIQLVSINRNTGLRSGGGDGSILEAFKPGTGPSDTYSIIGFQDNYNDGLTVSPEADSAIVNGTGGLY